MIITELLIRIYMLMCSLIHKKKNWGQVVTFELSANKVFDMKVMYMYTDGLV